MINPEVYAYFGSALLALSAFPQLVEIARDRRADGVSSTTWLITLAAIVAWMWYGVKTGSIPQLPGNAIGGLSAAAIVALTWKIRGHGWWVTWVPVTALVMALSIMLALTPSVASAAAGIGLATIGRAPQAVESWRCLRIRAQTSVSIPTWLMITVGQASWLVYGLLAGDVPVIWVNVIVGSGAALIVALEKIHPDRLPYDEAVGNRHR